MCNRIKWNECDLVIVIMMNDLESTSISMAAQCAVQLSGEAVAVAVVVAGVAMSGGGWSLVARVVVLSFFLFFAYPCIVVFSFLERVSYS